MVVLVVVVVAPAVVLTLLVRLMVVIKYPTPSRHFGSDVSKGKRGAAKDVRGFEASCRALEFSQSQGGDCSRTVCPQQLPLLIMAQSSREWFYTEPSDPDVGSDPTDSAPTTPMDWEDIGDDGNAQGMGPDDAQRAISSFLVQRYSMGHIIIVIFVLFVGGWYRVG